jgi:hypothetical protein
LTSKCERVIGTGTAFRRTRGRTTGSSSSRPLNFGGRTIEQRRVLSKDGDDLVLEMPPPRPPQGGDPTVVRLVYKEN